MIVVSLATRETPFRSSVQRAPTAYFLRGSGYGSNDATGLYILRALAKVCAMRAAMAVLPVGMSPQLHVTASQVDSGRHQGQLASYDPAHYVSYTNDAAD